MQRPHKYHNYELPKDIQEFLDKHGPMMSNNTWYSENGELKTRD